MSAAYKAQGYGLLKYPQGLKKRRKPLWVKIQTAFIEEKVLEQINEQA